MPQSKNEIAFQLDRMVAAGLGVLDANGGREYVRCLEKYQPEDMAAACDMLIDSWTERRFPRPGDIRACIQRILAQRPTGGFDKSGSTKYTWLFMKCLNMIFELANRDDFDRMRRKLISINEKYGDNERLIAGAKDEYIAFANEVKSLPQGRRASDMPKAIPGAFQIKKRPEQTTDSNLSF